MARPGTAGTNPDRSTAGRAPEGTKADERLDQAGPAWTAAFELAWESWRAGSLGIGSVLVDSEGDVVTRGRNRVLEPPDSGRVAGTLIAHAEIDAFAQLGLATAEGLSLYTTVEPCLMCRATAIAMRTARVCSAAPDPVFEGLDEALAAHSYMEGRMPAREHLEDDVLVSFAALLPLAHRVWSRPGQPPRREWLKANEAIWHAAGQLVGDGSLTRLARDDAPVAAVIDACAGALSAHGAI
jgi:tRNA(Arg) A34 adenosine deaminase TadA